jgi:MFS family permease
VTLETETILPTRPGHWASALRRPGFPGYLVAFGATSLAWNLGSVAFAWVTLVVTTDPLAVGAIFAVRFIALLVLGIPAGVLADRVDRRRLLIANFLGVATIAALLAILADAEGDSLPFWALLGGSLVLGMFDATRLAASNAYAYDLVGPALATTGIALANMIAISAAVAGNLVGGYVLGIAGLTATFTIMAFAMLVAAGALVLIRGRHAPEPRPPRAAPAGLHRSLTLLRRDRLMALLALVVIVSEVFGFSSMTLVPVFTRDVFDAGPDAYGAMSAVRSVGGVIGLLLLIGAGAGASTGMRLLLVNMTFGVALIAFALSPSFAVAIMPMLIVGAAAGTADSLSQALMQHSADDAERGAAMGIWAFAVGFGPAGHLAAGALAGRYGPVVTQVAFGIALGGLMLLLMTRPRLRHAR